MAEARGHNEEIQPDLEASTMAAGHNRVWVLCGGDGYNDGAGITSDWWEKDQTYLHVTDLLGGGIKLTDS